MNRQSRIKVLIVFFLLVVLIQVQSSPRELFAQLSEFASGIGKYRAGDLEGAIIDFETALSKDKENEKIKQYLLNALLGLGTKYLQEKDYKRALPYLGKAYKIAPTDLEIKELYFAAQAEMKPPPAPEVVQPALPKIEKVPAKPLLKPEIETKPKEPEKKVLVEKEKPEISTLEETLKTALSRLEKEREELLRYIKERDEERELKEDKERQKRFRLIVSLSLLATFSLVGIFFFFFRSSGEQRKEKILLRYQEKISAIKDMVEKSAPNVPTRAIEIIEETLAKDKIKEKEVAIKLLEPFLNDQNIQVKIRAAKCLYAYNPEMAFQLLRELTNNKNEEISASAIIALGEIGSLKAVEILFPLLSSPKTGIKKKVLQALSEVAENKRKELSPDWLRKIEKSIKETSIKEGWLIK